MQIIWRIRVLLFYLVAYSVSFIAYFIFTIAPINHEKKYNITMLFCSFVVNFVCKGIIGINYKVFGEDFIPKTASVVISNHQSFWENIFIVLLLPGRFSWVIKKELLKVPFFGPALGKLDPIIVDRKEDISVRKILAEGKEKLKSGLWVLFFPESTRLKPNEHAKFKPSGIKLAMISKVPIVLIAHNAGLFWPKGLWMRKPGTITVKIIKTIYPEEFEGKNVRDLTNEIEEIVNKNKDELAKEG